MTLNIQILIFSCILDLGLCSKDLPFTTCTKNQTQQKHRTKLFISKFYTNVCTAILLKTQGKTSCSKSDTTRTYLQAQQRSTSLSHMHTRAPPHSLFLTVLHVLSFHLKLVTSQSGYHHRQSI
jgi:hypothetical protein